MTEPTVIVEAILRWEEFLSRGKIANGEQKFVHYTSAETAVSIINNEAVWMRNASVMNDFKEIEHGQECFQAAYQTQFGFFFRSAIEAAHPGLVKQFEQAMAEQDRELKTETYITCLSEHDTSENSSGRLSMWRAYGATSGVALVVNTTPFLAETDNLSAYSHKVVYESAFRSGVRLMEMGQKLMDASSLLRTVDREWLLRKLVYFYRAFVLCTKHPGFAEEREWRIVHSPKVQPSAYLESELKMVAGTFQRIYKIPLRDDPEKGLFGASVEKLIDRVIIGPTRYPRTMRDAFVSLLESKNVADAHQKVVISEIPLRTA